ncbi:MAG TPA: glutamyl-tRNA reductase [Gaiellaceae bacterium]|nr:glutamyl-tRNA reductase [Gaiellaceae bacterium]
MNVVLVGTSHRHAPVELRELVAFGSGRAGEIAAALAGEDGEAVALSTCNRTELYLACDDSVGALERGAGALAALAGLPADELEGSFYTLLDEDAVLHLFRVAAGLDSMIRGEGQILGQIRSAFEAAQEADATGPALHRLFRHALRAGKRVRTETGIAENPASVATAAAELVERVFEDISGTNVLLLGAGKIGELAARELVTRGAKGIVVANRSVERASRLAERFGARVTSLEALEDELSLADIVVASTSSSGYVVTAEQVGRALAGRRKRPVFFVDIAVPRDLDPAINELPGCYLYDIDDLERVVAESAEGRAEETNRAEAILVDEAEQFRAWQRSRDVVPAITSLRELAETIRAQELARAEPRLGALSPRERRAVESLTTQIVNKLLHLPTVRLKEAAAAPTGAVDGVHYAEAVRHLFGLVEEDR